MESTCNRGALMHATMNLDRPEYPLIDPCGQDFQYKRPFKLLGIPEAPSDLTLPEKGFKQLQLLGLRAAIIRVFLDLTELSHAIQIYSENSGPVLCEDLLADCR